MNIRAANKLIDDRTSKKKLKDFKGKQFLVKITAGQDHFGFDENTMTRILKQNHLPSASRPIDELWVYDEFRFVCGATQNERMKEIVRQFGRLTGEKIFTKQIFLHARIHRANKNELEVRTDQLFHDQGW